MNRQMCQYGYGATWDLMIGDHEKPGSGRYSEVEFKWAMSHVVLCLIGLGDLWPGGFWALEFGLGDLWPRDFWPWEFWP